MLTLGIIGAENSHSYNIAKTCNIDKSVPMRVPLIWGETAKFARHAAELGQIAGIVKDWRELTGKVDGIMIDHRHPTPHFEVARFFIEKRVPLFVDKPFTYRLRHGKELLDLARRKRVPICTFSSIPLQTAFQRFKKQLTKSGTIRAVNSTGPVDLKTKYGGIFFYGIHQVDGIVELLGTDVKSVFVHKHLPNGVATLLFRSGAVATINCIKEGGGFHWMADTDKGILTQAHKYVAEPYRSSARIIYNLLKTKKNPFARERMLAPVAILEALEKSIKTGRPARVAEL